jgi:hypothetical protein
MPPKENTMLKSLATPLNTFSDALTLAVMAGLTIASAAALALPLHDAEPEIVRLPTVVVTAKPSHAEPVRLPDVVVTAKRISAHS